MRAIREHAFGPPENLRYEEVPDPRPDAGQVGIARAYGRPGRRSRPTTRRRLVPAVQTFALKHAAAAHRTLETRATVGKVVLMP